jgi:hypothetical protein
VDYIVAVVHDFDYAFQPASGMPFEIFNIGNSRPAKRSELVRMRELQTGKKAIRKQEAPQQGDVPLEAR